MISLIESMCGISVPRWVIELVLAALVLGGAVLYLEHRGAARELAKLQVSSARVIAQAKDQIKADTASYAAAQSINQGKLNAALSANTALQSNLTQRVRDFDAYRRAHPDVESSGGVTVTAPSRECGARSCGELAQELAARGTELAGAAGAASAALQACQRDRDALTGKP